MVSHTSSFDSNESHHVDIFFSMGLHKQFMLNHTYILHIYKIKYCYIIHISYVHKYI